MHCQDYGICVVGGAGHVGLPLALACAAARQRIIIHDVNQGVMDRIKGVHVSCSRKPGAVADRFELLGTLVPDIGRLTNRMWCYFAAIATVVTDRVETEEGITRLSVTEQDALARAADGRMEHALNLTALFLALSKGRLVLPALQQP